jgi:4a-hydroxytetrahydrobiopterin dehydratase
LNGGDPTPKRRIVMTFADLRDQPCDPKPAAVDADRAAELVGLLPGWELAAGEVAKTFRFENYHQTMAFANAVAWVAHRQDHHPEMEVGYNRCRVRYSTHSVGGLSDNDFASAAKVEALGAG